MAVYNGETGPNDGGNNHVATAYLVSGKGPILESDSALSKSTYSG